MQNLNDSNSEDSELELMLKKMETSKEPIIKMVVSILVLTLIATWCIYRSNWIVVAVDVFLIVLNVLTYFIIRRKTLRKVKQCLRVLAIKKIISTPVVVEEGNSMILTFLSPTERLIDEFKKLAEEANGKKK